MAAERPTPPPISIVVSDDRPLLGVIEFESGHEMTRYFTDDSPSRGEPAAPGADIEAALAAIGAWSDLDWDEMESALDRIRHESKPTPPAVHRSSGYEALSTFPNGMAYTTRVVPHHAGTA